MWSSLPAIALLASLLWMDVPFVRQDENGCGAASIAMVLQYWESKGFQVDRKIADPNHILERLYSKAHEGILATEVVRYFKDNGYNALVFAGTWQDLEHHVARGRPLIAGLQAEGSSTKFHYLVVAGIDSQENLVLVNDPVKRKLAKMTKHEFERRWDRTDRWTLLAVPEE